MFHSKFLVNRQMITDTSQINTSLMKYLSNDGKCLDNFFFRLEWYKIGISIPMDVYSEKMPLYQLHPECQLTNCEELESISPELKEIEFNIFFIPYKAASKNEDLDEKYSNSWLKKQLKGSAEIISSEFGPNNRLYYKQKQTDTKYKQIQSYTLRGHLKILNTEKLNEIRQKPLGYYPNLGCGLLMLK